MQSAGHKMLLHAAAAAGEVGLHEAAAAVLVVRWLTAACTAVQAEG